MKHTRLNLGGAFVAWVLAGVIASSAQAKHLNGPERAEAVEQGWLGSPAPKLVVRTIDGERIDLASFYGKKAVYLKFWATWCHPCREQMPHLEHTYENEGSDLAVIAIDIGFNDTVEDVRQLRSKLGLTMPIVFDDGRLGEAFHLRVTPQHVVIGRDGRIQYVGWLADQHLEDALITARKTGNSSASSTAGATVAQPTGYGVGDRLPALPLRMLDGNAFDPQRSDGNATVLVFLWSGCESSYIAEQRPKMSEACQEVREQLAALAKENLHVRWLGIASGVWATQDDLAEYRDQYKPGISLALDETDTWFRSFHVTNTPTIFIADSAGKIVRRFDGFDPSLPKAIVDIVGK